MTAKRVVVTGLRPQARPPKPRAPRRGDIILIDFSPAAGREMLNPHPALVVSADDYNATFRMAVVLAISTVANEARDNHFAVPLMGTGCTTTGVVIADRPRSLDLEARTWRLLETAPALVVEEATAILTQVIGL